MGVRCASGAVSNLDSVNHLSREPTLWELVLGNPKVVRLAGG